MSKEYETLKFTQRVYEKEIKEIEDMYQKEVKELQDEVWNLKELVDDIQAATERLPSDDYCGCEEAVAKEIKDYEADKTEDTLYKHPITYKNNKGETDE
jgi:esterase/lipase|tara:strand:+ start:152 stop:448 length:297 start_codon:yes stop_codon:yes gene_type:complete